MMTIPDGNEMVLIEYQGRNVGSVNFGGPGTLPSGRYYRFGANPKDKVKYVAKADLDWFYSFREEGQRTFFPKAVESPKQPEGTLQPTGDLTVKVQRIVEDDQPPVATPVVTEAPSLDPGTMTLKQIEALSLTNEEWKDLGKKELKGRKRTSVLSFIRSKVNHD